jgi:hypothetical protein
MRIVAVLRGVTVTAVGISLLAKPVFGQSAQPFSLQGSVLAASQAIGGDPISGTGVELQMRFTPASLWSVGLGFQHSSHGSGGDNIKISGVFLEPRYAIDVGSDRLAPYLAGRLAMLKQSLVLDETPGATFESNGTAFGGGAGLLIRATKIINVDIGAALVRQSFADAEDNRTIVRFNAFTGYVAKAGVSIGFGSR